MRSSNRHHSHEISIRRCSEGCIVLQFGLTMIHLEPNIFQQFAQIVMATSIQLDQEQKRRRIAELQAGSCQGRVEPVDLDLGFEA